MPSIAGSHNTPPGLFLRLRLYQEKLARYLTTIGTLSTPKPIHSSVCDIPNIFLDRTLQQKYSGRSQAPNKVFPAIQNYDQGDSRSWKPLSVLQQNVLNDVLHNKQSYLLLGRVGIGKSVMLESFARQMTVDNKRSLGINAISTPLRIPLLVRLRDFTDLNATQFNITILFQQAQIKLFPHDNTSHLRLEDIEFLAKCGALVPMFDGFDEIIHQRAFCDILRETTGPAGILHRCSYIITSRPEADITLIPIEEEYHRIISPLTDCEIKEYVTEKRNLPNDKLINVSTVIRRLLSQPLYLCVWCNCIAIGQDPRTVADLMEEMLADHLERRELIFSRAKCGRNATKLSARQQQLEGLRTFLGRLCTRLFQNDFGVPSSFTDLGKLTNKEQEYLAAVAGFSGIVELTSRTLGVDKFVINQAPIVEYLIGRHLAEQFLTDTTDIVGANSLDIFRKLVWRLSAYNILDYFFDSLWNSSNGKREYIASELIKWLAGITAIEVNRKETLPRNNVLPQDDYLRPFAISALRWLCLKQSIDLQDPIVGFVVKSTVQAIDRAGHLANEYLRDVLLSIGQPVSAQLVNKLLEVAICIEATNRHHFGALLEAVAGSVAEDDACAYVDQWLEAAAIIDNRALQTLFSGAILGAARCIPTGRVYDCIKVYLNMAANPNYNDIRFCVFDAIAGAASHIDQKHAYRFIQRCFEAGRNIRDSENSLLSHVYDCLGGAIEAAAKRLPTAKAYNYILNWSLGVADLSELEGRHVIAAIAAAVEMLSESDAYLCLQHLLGSANYGDSQGCLASLQSVIYLAAARISRENALVCVETCMSVAKSVPTLESTYRNHIYAISGAASRLPEKQCYMNIRTWIKALVDPKNDVPREALLGAIEGAAWCISDQDAYLCIKDLLQYIADLQGSDIDYRLVDAIRCAASRVAQEYAFPCVKCLHEAHSNANYRQVQFLLEASMCAAAKRIPSTLHMDAVLWSLKNSAIEVAFAIAASGTEVAIISSLSAGDESANVLVAKRRSEMKLTADLPVGLSRYRDPSGSEIVIPMRDQQLRPTEKNQRKYIFCRVAKSVWQMACGETHPTEVQHNRVGFEHIARLLCHPGKRIGDLELIMGDRPELVTAEDEVRSDAVMDHISARELAAERRVLTEKRDQLLALELSGNGEVAVQAKEHRQQIECQLKKLPASTHYRKKMKTPAAKASTRVSAALEDALAFLESLKSLRLDSLVTHLRLHIKPLNYGHIYLPEEPPFPWESEWKIPSHPKSDQLGE